MGSLVFDIARGGMHDGPGIRTTVFLKGCPLRCQWCHNPESQRFSAQISFSSRLCIHCGQCQATCETGAHAIKDGVHTLNFNLCVGCGQCVAACPASALTLFGREMTPDEVFTIVRRDKPFFDRSDGGVTVSGGEPLAHAEFCVQLLNLCRADSIHTCVETSGMGSPEALGALMEVTDLFLFDWKLSDDAAAVAYTGADARVIRRNLSRLLDLGANVVLRCPVIPGVNDTPEHFESIAALLLAHPALRAELLPYHNFGVGKGDKIGSAQTAFRMPSEEETDGWTAFFRRQGLDKDRIA